FSSRRRHTRSTRDWSSDVCSSDLSYIVLTAAVPDKLEEINWTGGESVWDFRAALHYLRTTPDGRLSFGVGGLQPGLARTIGPRRSEERRVGRECATRYGNDQELKC